MNTLFFEEILLIIIEGFYEFGVSSYLNVSKPLDNYNGEVLGQIIGYISLIFVFLIPFILIILLFFKIDTLKK